MISLEYENVRDLQGILSNFKADNRVNRPIGFRQGGLVKSNGLSLSMVSISSSGQADLTQGDWADHDPGVWSPPATDQ